MSGQRPFPNSSDVMLKTVNLIDNNGSMSVLSHDVLTGNSIAEYSKNSGVVYGNPNSFFDFDLAGLAKKLYNEFYNLPQDVTSYINSIDLSDDNINFKKVFYKFRGCLDMYRVAFADEFGKVPSLIVGSKKYDVNYLKESTPATLTYVDMNNTADVKTMVEMLESMKNKVLDILKDPPATSTAASPSTAPSTATASASPSAASAASTSTTATTAAAAASTSTAASPPAASTSTTASPSTAASSASPSAASAASTSTTASTTAAASTSTAASPSTAAASPSTAPSTAPSTSTAAAAPPPNFSSLKYENNLTTNDNFNIWSAKAVGILEEPQNHESVLYVIGQVFNIIPPDYYKSFLTDKPSTSSSASSLSSISKTNFFQFIVKDPNITSISKDGTLYVGQTNGPKKQGKGMMRWANGNIFEGEFDNDFILLNVGGIFRENDATTGNLTITNANTGAAKFVTDDGTFNMDTGEFKPNTVVAISSP